MNEKIKTYCSEFINDNILIVPFKLKASEQKLPIEFQIKLELSTSKLEFPRQINFERIYEHTSKVKWVEFKNHSSLV